MQTNRRFWLGTLVLPAAMVFAVGPLLSAVSRLSGHRVVDGSVEVRPGPFVVVAVGNVVVVALIVTALLRRLPLTRLRWAPMPLTAACAVWGAVLVGGSLPTSAPIWVVVAALLIGGTVGGLLGRRWALGLLALHPLPISIAGAPSNAIRHPLADHATAVWSGRLPPLSLRSWAIVAVMWASVTYVPLAVGHRRVTIVESAVTVVLFIAVHLFWRANKRMRITIGPAGIRLHSGVLRRWGRQPIAMDTITAASTGTIARRPVTDWLRPQFLPRWYGSAHRLTIATRSGSALVLRLSDGTGLRISLSEPWEPAAVINSLLDQRARPDGTALAR